MMPLPILLLFAFLEEEGQAVAAPTGPQMPSALSNLIDIFVLLIALAFVIALVVISLRLMGRTRSRRSSGNIKVVEAASVGFQNTVQLVHVGDKYFLIGVSRTGITVIGEVNPDSITIEDKARAMQGNAVPFEKYLSKFFNRGKDKMADEEGRDNERDNG